MDSKKWYRSRTFWVNVIAAAAAVLVSESGIEIDADAQVSVLAVVNLVLRSLTKTGLTT